MANDTITSANSVFTLTVPGLFPAPVQLRGYAVDKAFSVDKLKMAETQMGVDGRLTAGFTPEASVMKIHLQADSPSKAIFKTIAQAMKTTRDVYYINGSITFPSTGETFALTRGVMTSFDQMAEAAKVLQPVEHEITWENIAIGST